MVQEICLMNTRIPYFLFLVIFGEISHTILNVRKLDLGNRNTIKSIMQLALPSMLAQLVSVLYSIVDRIFIGNMSEVGEIALIGVGVVAPITTFITSFAYWVGYGGSPIFSMSLGEKNEENAKKILSNSFIMLIALSALIMCIFYPLGKPLLYLFGASEASFPYAYQYFLIYLGGTFFSILTLGLNQFVIAQGKSLLAMFVTLLGAILNVILDPIFIYVCNMGVAGAAWATLISQFVSFLFVLFLLLKVTDIKLSFQKIDWKIVKKIISLGFSPFVILATDSVIYIALNTCIKSFAGNDADFYIEIATITQAFFSLFTGPLLGISTGTQPLLAYNYGSKQIDLIKKAEKQLIAFALIFTSISFVISFFIGSPFARLFISLSSSNPNENVISMAGKVISIYMYGIIPLSFQYVCVDGLTGLGQAKYSIWLSLFRKIVLLLPLTILLPLCSGDAFFVFYAEPIADTIASFTSLIVYLILMPRILRKRENQTTSVLE